MKYQKLIRDNIPEIIEKNGGNPVTHIADDKEYWHRLKEKLKEEVDEFLEKNNKEELADILEVIYAICESQKIDKNKLEELRRKKAKKRGAFNNRIILDGIK